MKKKNHKKNRWIAAVLAAAMVFAMALSAGAQTAEEWIDAQLSKSGQGMYDNFVKDLHALRVRPSSKFSGTQEQATEDFKTIVTLIKKQNPEIFWIGYDEQVCSITSGTNVIHYDPTFLNEFAKDGKLDSEKIKSMQEKLKEVVQEVGKSKNTYDSVKHFNSWLCSNVTYSYNYSNPRVYEITGALLDKKTACEGFAKAFKYLCDNAGIPCVVVSGTGILGGVVYDHEWNYVQMPDKKWYLVDTTWNALGADKERWFLRGSSDAPDGVALLRSHAPERKYPDLAAQGYQQK